MGPLEQSVSTALEVVATADVPMRDPLAALALTLARFLDDGAGNSTPATAAQLRIVLESLTPPDTSADDEFRAFMTQMTESE